MSVRVEPDQAASSRAVEEIAVAERLPPEFVLRVSMVLDALDSRDKTTDELARELVWVCAEQAEPGHEQEMMQTLEEMDCIPQAAEIIVSHRADYADLDRTTELLWQLYARATYSKAILDELADQAGDWRIMAKCVRELDTCGYLYKAIEPLQRLLASREAEHINAQILNELQRIRRRLA